MRKENNEDRKRYKKRQPLRAKPWDSITWGVFFESAHSTARWRTNAMALFRAAHILLPKIDGEWEKQEHHQVFEMRQIYLMLIGYSFEALGKAFLIQKQSPLTENGKFYLDSHDLLDLYEKAQVVLNEKDSFLLERLGQYVKWAGRYPIPKE